MPKFDIKSSYYLRLWDKDSNRLLQTVVDQSNLIQCNYGWYKTQGHKANFATPTGNDNLATFTVKSRKIEAAPLMDLRAPLGDGNQTDGTGVSFYSATIPDFISTNGYKETAVEREAYERQLANYGNDDDLVQQWLQNRVQALVDSADATMNNMTAQLISKGFIDWSELGRGIQAPIHKANIPSENFVKAGAKVWTDTDNCLVLEQMKKIEDSFRDKWGFTGAMKWQIPYKMFHEVILENAQVKELIKDYRHNPLLYHAVTEGQSFTEAAFNQALIDYEGISPIEIVKEKERNLTHTKDVFVHGWKESVAVLRPAGDAVEFQWKDKLDQSLFEKFGNETIQKVWAKTNDGLGTLVNTTMPNGLYKEWHTDIMLSAVPALIEFNNHVIVDTLTAD